MYESFCFSDGGGQLGYIIYFMLTTDILRDLVSRVEELEHMHPKFSSCQEVLAADSSAQSG